MLTARKSGGSTFDALRFKGTTKKRNNVFLGGRLTFSRRVNVLLSKSKAQHFESPVVRSSLLLEVFFLNVYLFFLAANV